MDSVFLREFEADLLDFFGFLSLSQSGKDSEFRKEATNKSDLIKSLNRSLGHRAARKRV